MSEHIETAAGAGADLRADTERKYDAERVWPTQANVHPMIAETIKDRHMAFGVGWDAALAWQAAQPRTVSAEQYEAAVQDAAIRAVAEDAGCYPEDVLDYALAALNLTVAEAGEDR